MAGEDVNAGQGDDSLARKYRRLIDIGRALSAQKDMDSLLERILREAKSMLNADAGTLYLRTPENTLMFAIVLNDTLGIAQGGTTRPFQWRFMTSLSNCRKAFQTSRTLRRAVRLPARRSTFPIFRPLMGWIRSAPGNSTISRDMSPGRS